MNAIIADLNKLNKELDNMNLQLEFINEQLADVDRVLDQVEKERVAVVIARKTGHSPSTVLRVLSRHWTKIKSQLYK